MINLEIYDNQGRIIVPVNALLDYYDSNSFSLTNG